MSSNVEFSSKFVQPTAKTYTIDKNVPIPNVTFNKKGRWDHVIEAMEIGDSIAFSNRQESDQLLSALRNRGFKNCVGKDSAGSYRVWKLAPFES